MAIMFPLLLFAIPTTAVPEVYKHRTFASLRVLFKQFVHEYQRGYARNDTELAHRFMLYFIQKLEISLLNACFIILNYN